MHIALPLRFTFAALLLTTIAGCGTPIDTSQVNADRFTLYSIDGNHYRPDDPKAPAADAERFQGWPVLGKKDIAAKEDREALLKAMQQGIDDNDGSVANCFIPRHAMQIVTGDLTTDYLICFQCMQIYIYKTRDGTTKESSKLTTNGPRRVFDAQLRKANLPLAN